MPGKTMLASLFAIATTFFAIQAVHGLSLQPSSEDFTTESQPRHAERHERRQQIIVVNQTALVLEACSHGDQASLSDCTTTLNQDISQSIGSYCQKEYGERKDCVMSYDYDASQCPDAQFGFNDCANLTLLAYQTCMDGSGFYTHPDLANCANKDLQIIPPSGVPTTASSSPTSPFPIIYPMLFNPPPTETAAILPRKDVASISIPTCPDSDGTVYTNPNGQQYLIACSTDLPGYDLLETTVSSLVSCAEACDEYNSGENIPGNDRPCVGVTFHLNAALEGSNCFLKYKILTSEEYEYPDVVSAALLVGYIPPAMDHPLTVTVTSYSDSTTYVTLTTPTMSNMAIEENVTTEPVETECVIETMVRRLRRDEIEARAAELEVKPLDTAHQSYGE